MLACSPELIAPGVWKFDLGPSEKITPFSVLQPRPLPGSFEALPSVLNCPLNGTQISSRSTRRGFEIRLPLGPDEKIYGLGLQLLSFNQTGLKKTLRVNSDPRADLGDSHAPVPFYVSTAGYGLMVDTARYATFYCGSASPIEAKSTPGNAGRVGLDTETLYAARGPGASRQMVIEVPGAEGVAVLVFAGPGLREVVQRYNLFSGGGVVPPRWALGVWYRLRADFDQEVVGKLAGQLRQEKIPCDVLGLEPGWQSHAYSCSHVWSDKFPDPARLVSDLREQRFRLNVWTHAFTDSSSPIFAPLLPHAGEHTAFGGLVPDFLRPEAERIFAGHYKSEVVDPGVSGFKLDECDNSDFIKNPWSFPEFSRFPSGADGEQMHSLFGVLQQRMIDRLYQSTGRRTYGLVRSSHAFASRFPFVLYSDLYDHRQFVRGIVTASFSGLLWTPEIREAASGVELVRRLQSAVVSSLVLINAWYIKNPPWKQWEIEANNRDQFLPDWPEWQEKCRAVLELRMRLIPYLHGAFYRYAKEGIPPFRPLVMDYPDAPESWNRDDQILVGDRIMAAPMIGDAPGRTAWLPPGKWIDFWTGEMQEGNRVIEIMSAQDKLPLFVKDGSVLPLALPTLHTEDPVSFQLEVRVYGNGSLPVTLLEESQPEMAFDETRINLLELSWDAKNEQVSSHRKRADLSPLYAVVRQIRVNIFQAASDLPLKA
ncbi:MAG: glycoside hydrolase family 31 protein [Methylacidiphilales bacterium]|nr:glycoside hydrolase family 31 protein [Candidatus Methylacidiphilales bacterium]